MALILELNIALIPEEQLAQKHQALSEQLATKFPAVVQLGGNNEKLAFTPHLTLYQVPLIIDKISLLDKLLSNLTHTFSLPPLVCTGYAYNEGEASFEAQYGVTDGLVEMQEQLIAQVNPLRDGLLLERDPAGNKVADLLTEKHTIGDNVRQTGYAEVGDPRKGGLFRPHVTLNWFARGTQIDTTSKFLPEISTLNGKFVALGVFLLGPYGTCPQRLTSYFII